MIGGPHKGSKNVLLKINKLSSPVYQVETFSLRQTKHSWETHWQVSIRFICAARGFCGREENYFDFQYKSFFFFFLSTSHCFAAIHFARKGEEWNDFPCYREFRFPIIGAKCWISLGGNTSLLRGILLLYKQVVYMIVKLEKKKTKRKEASLQLVYRGTTTRVGPASAACWVKLGPLILQLFLLPVEHVICCTFKCLYDDF